MPQDTSDVVVNHLGHCVEDLDRSRRFYQEVFGFEEWRSLRVPDQPTNRLLQIEAPLGMTALYLKKGSLVLELMRFDRPGNPSPANRPMNQPGFTHLSFSVDDVAATAAKVADLGGTVLPETDVGMAVFVRDPDGQLIELLPMSYRRSVEGGS